MGMKTFVWGNVVLKGLWIGAAVSMVYLDHFWWALLAFGSAFIAGFEYKEKK